MADPEPRPAATVVVLRDSRQGLQVLLTVRPEHLRFMGGAVVFPGGAVATADLDPRWEDGSTRSRSETAAALGLDDPAAALGAFVCALREAYEEVGLLLATGPIERLTRADADDPGRFLERCLELRIVLATDRMVPAGRWVTPLGSPVRFDARFFLAEAPAGWGPAPDEREVAACRWATPAQALAELAAGETIMAPPTIEMLQRLDAHPDVAGALAALGQRATTGSPSLLTTRLSPLVQVVLAPNGGLMTGPGTNTYMVGTGPHVIVDPAVDDPSYLDAVYRAAGEVAAILITHRHPDHIGGVAALHTRTGAPVRAFGEGDAGGVAVAPLHDDEVVAVPGIALRTLHTPGHARDHLCFYLEGAASLFSGDNILGEGTAVIAPPDGDMRAYLGSLERLRALHVDRIYPGHWRALHGGRAVIDTYIAHRHERAAAILNALAEGMAEVEEVVAHVYRDVPEQLHPVARFQVLAHLEMLEESGRVARRGERWAVKPIE